jgi:hypothetical protein
VDFVIRRRENEKVLASTSDVQDGREMVAGMTGGDEEKGSSEARK